MKKRIIMILFCIVFIVMVLGGCAKGFVIRGYEIGDSVEAVKEKEGREPDYINEQEEINRISLRYFWISFLDSEADIECIFYDGKLIAITIHSKQNYSDVEKAFEELVQELEQDYGAPDSKEEDDYFENWSATWYKGGYFLTLYLSEDGFSLLSAPSSK